MSEDDCTISLETLRQVFNEAMDNLAERVGDVVELDEDFSGPFPVKPAMTPTVPQLQNSSPLVS